MIRLRPFVLRRYVSGARRLWAAAKSVEGRAAARWARRAFAQFEASSERRTQMLLWVVEDALQLTTLANDLDANRKRFVDLLLKACQRVDSGGVRHSSARLRSYVDVSVQMNALRTFATYLSSRRAFAGDPKNVTALILDEQPDSRPALLAHAQLLIERGQLDDAVVAIQRALRIQAVCPTAQQLLGRAYAAQRELGGRAGELDGTNYDLRDRFCPVPFTHLSTGFKGDAFICCCPAWVPFPVGNVIDAPSAEAVWNSDVAQEIRRSIHDGDFGYCSRTLCSFIAAQKLPSKAEITDPLFRRYIDERSVILEDVPKLVELNHDPTCNLACPSCRTEIIAANAEEQDLYAESARRVILPLLRKVKGHSYVSGGGEVFSSKHYRSILRAVNRAEYPDLYLYLITNGLLATEERWSRFPDLPEMIGILSVSIDAARAETYEQLRRPGKWPVLMKNLELMAEMRRSGSIRRLQINFVVQADNYREIPEFVDLGMGLGVDSIWFQRLTNYGAYTEDVFAKADVTSPAHPKHEELLDILRSPLMKHPVIDMRLLMPLLPEVVASDAPDSELLRLASAANAYELRGGFIEAQPELTVE